MWLHKTGSRASAIAFALGCMACTGDVPSAPSRLAVAANTSVGVADALVAVRAPIDLGSLGSQPGNAGSIASDVNAAGWVVGEAHTETNALRAFLWTPSGGMVNLGTLQPTDTYSRAEAINDAGWIVGTSGSGGLSEAVLWRPGEPPVALGIPGGRSSGLNINNAGLIVGAYEPGPGGQPLRGFSWHNGVFRDLPTLGGNLTRALGVNDAGVAAGGSRKLDSVGEEAVTWPPGAGPVDLGVTAAVDARRSAARGINNRGEVVGFAFPTSGGIAPFLFRPGVGAALLGAPGIATGGEAYAIDDAGRAVGYLQGDAWLWHPDAGAVPLPKAASASTAQARSISNSGYIAGYVGLAGGRTGAVLWQMDRPPIADAGGPYTGGRKKPVVFDATGSTDPDGDALTYLWAFGDGTAPESGATPTHEYADWGTYTVTVTVSDPYGLTSTHTTTATIAPPGHFRRP